MPKLLEIHKSERKRGRDWNYLASLQRRSSRESERAGPAVRQIESKKWERARHGIGELDAVVRSNFGAN
jgi:hypothetical protein